MFLVRPNVGVLAVFLSTNTNINSVIINNKIHMLNNYNTVRFNLFKYVLEFLVKLFSFNSRFSCFLNEDTAPFYIRFSYINFVKLYSHSSNSELNEINKKIVEIGNKIRARATSEKDNLNENIDKLENEFKKKNSRNNDELKHF